MWFDPFVHHFMMTATTALTLEARQKAQPVGLPAETPRRERRAARPTAKARTRKATR